MMEVIRMPTIPNVEIPYPDLGMKDQFAKQPGMRYGSLSIENDRIRVDDGTSTTVQIDSAGFHGYNHASQELVRVNYLGFHGYTTAGVELVTVDGSGFTGSDASGNAIVEVNATGFHASTTAGVEIIKVDATGFHAYNSTPKELVRLDASGLHGYDTSANEIITLDLDGLQIADTSGNVLVVLDASGFKIQDSSGNKLLQSDATGFETYRHEGAADVSVAKMEDDGVILRNTRGVFFEETTTAQYGDIVVNASDQMIVGLPSTNQFFVVNYAGDTNLFTVSDKRSYCERLKLKQLTSDPGNNEVGDIVYADGSNWDPGNGVGIYVYINTGAGAKWHSFDVTTT